ncbi:hypothetical protein P171DRAFT_28813 [Karstenula rhodostoma CBS 690.94]|uniref:Uncharacterized protein n=1 Tax=Karstenula rhodostoma CBS 690.94 TaxID=1392251 RepID=A0A9P4PHR7_9PLEO|nr:hypothetical protein P171DRAFT_28813 [Karstenula rhodostoma CBS 690.94]
MSPTYFWQGRGVNIAFYGSLIVSFLITTVPEKQVLRNKWTKHAEKLSKWLVEDNPVGLATVLVIWIAQVQITSADRIRTPKVKDAAPYRRIYRGWET